jgi:argininosuccinate lyase
VAAAYAAESAHGPRLARGLSLADLAHAVALIEGGDLAGEDAKSLLRGLLELHAIPDDEFTWDPSLGDAFRAREAELERRVGRSAAGWLSAGRLTRGVSRRARLTARTGARGCMTLVDQAAALVRARAQRARRSRPTTPTPAGTSNDRQHLLLAYAYPALRDGDQARARTRSRGEHRGAGEGGLALVARSRATP